MKKEKQIKRLVRQTIRIADLYDVTGGAMPTMYATCITWTCGTKAC